MNTAATAARRSQTRPSAVSILRFHQLSRSGLGESGVSQRPSPGTAPNAVQATMGAITKVIRFTKKAMCLKSPRNKSEILAEFPFREAEAAKFNDLTRIAKEEVVTRQIEQIFLWQFFQRLSSCPRSQRQSLRSSCAAQRKNSRWSPRRPAPSRPPLWLRRFRPAWARHIDSTASRLPFH